MNASATRAPAGGVRWIARVAGLLAGVGVAASMALFAVNRQISIPPGWNAAGGSRDAAIDWLNVSLFLLQALTGIVIGALVMTRQPRNRIGWLLVCAGFGGILMRVIEEITILSVFDMEWQSPGTRLVSWLQNWFWALVFAFTLLTVALFPSGAFLSRRWNWIVGVPLLLFVALTGFSETTSEQMSASFQLQNPFFTAVPPALSDTLYIAGMSMVPLTVLAILAQIVARYRAGDYPARQQIKWLVVGIAAMLVSVTLGLILALGAGRLEGRVLVNIATIFPLLGMGVGILRYRLFDIDLIIRRTAVYGLLTGLLALIYFGSVIAMQAVAQGLTGQAGDSPIIIVASTLLIAALFTPLRRRLQNSIDRRFYRQKYDAQQVLARFAATARDEVSLEALTGEVTRVVQETLQPAAASIWLREESPGSRIGNRV